MFEKPYLVDIDTAVFSATEQLAREIGVIATLAEANGSRLILCASVESPPSIATDSVLQDRILAARKENAYAILRQLAGAIDVHEPPELLIAVGKPFVTISRLVVEHDVGVIVSFAPDGLGHPVNSRLMHLVRKCPAAVWLWRDPAQTRVPVEPLHIAVPIDRDIFAGSAVSGDMAERLLNAALLAAAGAPARITLLHAWRPYGIDVLGAAGDALEPAALQDYIDGQAYAHAVWLEERQRYLDDLIAASGRGATTACAAELLAGKPGDSVPAWLDANDVDLLVLGTTGTGAVPGQLIGDTAETILLRSRMPVLSVKPADFRSPVVAPAASTPTNASVA